MNFFIVLWGIFITVCSAVRHLLFPHPVPKGATPGRKQFHIVSHIPYKAKRTEWLNRIRYTRWEGEGVFRSVVIAGKGFPTQQEKKRCFQIYAGIKVDGAETLSIQGNSPTAHDLTFEEKEQVACRIILMPYSKSPNVYNMAGE